MKIFEDFCTAEELTYHYGTQNVLNIIDRRNDFTGQCVYFLHDINRETPILTELGRIQAISHSGKFMIVVPSDFDKQFEDKIKDNVEPLRIYLQKLLSKIACSDNTVRRFSYIPVVDVKDINFDGWLVDYQIDERV